jgi:histidyl-tRNA synthetase
VRQAGISAEMYPDAVKMKKQMSYANAKGIPFVVMAGETEMKEGVMALKNMVTGEQRVVKVNELVDALK